MPLPLPSRSLPFPLVAIGPFRGGAIYIPRRPKTELEPHHNMPGSAVVDLRNTYGAIFIALLFNVMLFGFEIVQAFKYYSTYWNRDKRAFKIFVAFMLVMDTLSTIMCAYGVYWYFILNFGSVESLEKRVWALNLQPLFSTLPSSSVQLYYARRAYLCEFSAVGYTSEPQYSTSEPKSYMPDRRGAIYPWQRFLGIMITHHEIPTEIWLPCLWMGATVFTDILITVTMCWALYRKRTGFARCVLKFMPDLVANAVHRTDSIILTLVVYTVNSGVLLSTLGIAMTICFAVAPSSMIWIAFFWVGSKCYINSLLAMLNTRDYIRDRSITDNQDNAYNLSSIRLEPPNEAYGSKSRQAGVTVTVHHSTASDFVRSKSDHTKGTTFEDPKPV
ncbi:hypothetical protein EI94DRAFT_1833265 [Lactarius quietus]|nr:hypothetical protein EI94DRAFT_1833265 [Lactarius quietus]